MGQLGTAQCARTYSFQSRILPTGYKVTCVIVGASGARLERERPAAAGGGRGWPDTVIQKSILRRALVWTRETSTSAKKSSISRLYFYLVLDK